MGVLIDFPLNQVKKSLDPVLRCSLFCSHPTGGISQKLMSDVPVMDAVVDGMASGESSNWNLTSLDHLISFPKVPYLEYLPTLTPIMAQMQVYIPYMKHMGWVLPQLSAQVETKFQPTTILAHVPPMISPKDAFRDGDMIMTWLACPCLMCSTGNMCQYQSKNDLWGVRSMARKPSAFN